ncbi:MAG: hypothetical protein ACK4IX_16600, partial [Candidatus Sericytochromatia bacterium]
KAINKYQILLRFKHSSSVSNEYKNLIPDILDENKGNIFETILTLYIIVLFEFYNDKFKEIEDYDSKLNKYLLDYYDSKKIKLNINSIDEIKSKFFLSIQFDKILVNFARESINQMTLSSTKSNNNTKDIMNLRNINTIRYISIFTPISKGSLLLDDDNNTLIQAYSFIQQFLSKEDRILYLFSYYLLDSKNIDNFIPKNYNIFDIFKMAKTLL